MADPENVCWCDVCKEFRSSVRAEKGKLFCIVCLSEIKR